MPNHVKNIITFVGAKRTINKLLKQVLVDDRFNFETIIPMPEELGDTTTPTKIISKQEYNLQEKEIKRIAKKIKDNIELTTEEELKHKWGFSRGLTNEISNEYKEKFGFDNWYDWSLHNWDTKWNSYGLELDLENNTISFDTAWSMPFNVLDKLSTMYPTLELNVKYADEDTGYNVGEFVLKNGVITKHNKPKGGTYEAYALALEIRGELDYYLEDVLPTIMREDRDIENDRFAQVLLKIAYENNGYIENYDDTTLNAISNMALADENYELMGTIHKILSERN
jgi:hypothetical protein